MESVFPPLAGWFLTTVSPGKSLPIFLNCIVLFLLSCTSSLYILDSPLSDTQIAKNLSCSLLVVSRLNFLTHSVLIYAPISDLLIATSGLTLLCNILPCWLLFLPWTSCPGETAWVGSGSPVYQSHDLQCSAWFSFLQFLHWGEWTVPPHVRWYMSQGLC